MSKLLSDLAKGTWLIGTAYTIGDIVDSAGSSYICIANTTGNIPPNATYWALLASKGATGATGSQGIQGIQGVIGPDGVSSGLNYNFDTSTTDSDPGSGNVRLNNASFASVTSIFLDNLESAGGDVTGFIDTWDDSTNTTLLGYILIRKIAAKENFALFKVTGAVTDGTGYRKVVVVHLASNGSFSAADPLSIEFTRTGNKGDAGTGDFLANGTVPMTGDLNFDGNNISNGGVIFLKEQAAADADVAGSGQIWVATGAPDILMFTDEAGTDFIIVNTTGVQTLTNKALTPRVVTTTDSASAVIDVDVTDQYQLTAIANATTFTITGTPVNGRSLIIRLKDAGVAKALTWDTIFNVVGQTLPTTTVPGKTHYIGCKYNSANSKMDVLAVGVEA